MGRGVLLSRLFFCCCCWKLVLANHHLSRPNERTKGTFHEMMMMYANAPGHGAGTTYTMRVSAFSFSTCNIPRRFLLHFFFYFLFGLSTAYGEAEEKTKQKPQRCSKRMDGWEGKRAELLLFFSNGSQQQQLYNLEAKKENGAADGKWPSNYLLLPIFFFSGIYFILFYFFFVLELCTRLNIFFLDSVFSSVLAYQTFAYVRDQ